MDMNETSTINFDEFKKKLEIEKLEKEIQQLDNLNSDLAKKWYKKPQWIMALSPVIVGVLTLTVAWASGFLQAQFNLNKIQEENFNRRKDSINIVISKLSTTSDSLNKLIINFKTENIMLGKQNREFKAIHNTLSNKLLSNEEKLDFMTERFIQSKNEKYHLTAMYYKILSMLKRNEQKDSLPLLEEMIKKK